MKPARHVSLWTQLLALLAALPALAQEAPEPPTPTPCASPGIRYFYADLAHKKDNKVFVYACKNILHKLAVDCSAVGQLDLSKIEEAKEKAKTSVFAYLKGLAAGMACGLTVSVGTQINKPLGLAGRLVDNRFGEDTARDVLAETMAGERKPGDDTKVKHNGLASRICSAVKNTGSESYRDGAEHGLSAAHNIFAMPWVYKADAKYIWSLPPGEARQKAFAEWQAKLKEKEDRQQMVIKETSKRVEETWKFLTTGEVMEVPFGTSPATDISPNTCLTPRQLSKVKQTLERFMEFLKDTKLGLEKFQPEEGILVPTSREDLLKLLRGERQRDTVKGANEFVPAEQSAPSLP